jgi:four helix bundle protein
VSGIRYPVSGIRLHAESSWSLRKNDGDGRITSHEDFGVASFRKLRVWQEAQAMAIDAHRLTSRMRGASSAPLRDQFRRAAMSVPSNIVEGSAHTSRREFARFLNYALGSVSEVEGHAQLAHDLALMPEKDFTAFLARIVNVRKMLHGLLKRVKRDA